MIAALLLAAALPVSVEPAFVRCAPSGSVHAWAVEAGSPDAAVRGVLDLRDAATGRGGALAVDVPAGGRMRFVVPVPPSDYPLVVWRPEGGAEQDVPVPPRAACPGPVIAVLEDPGVPGSGARARLPASPDATWALGELVPSDLDAPRDALAAVDAIVADARVLAGLPAERWAALRGWTSDGGALVIVPGGDPGALVRAGRMPGSSEADAASPREAHVGAGLVAVLSGDAVRPEPGQGGSDPLPGYAMRASARRNARSSLEQRIAQVWSAVAPAFAVGTGELVLFAALLSMLAGGEWALRRNRIGTRRDPRGYVVTGAAGLGIACVLALLGARASVARSVADPVLLVENGTALRFEPRVVGAGRTRTLGAEERSRSTGFEVRRGRRTEVRNPEAQARVHVTARDTDPGGSILFSRIGPGAWKVRNDSGLSLGPGLLSVAGVAFEVPPLSPGSASETLPASTGSRDPRRVLAAVLHPVHGVYVAPAPEGTVVAPVPATVEGEETP